MSTTDTAVNDPTEALKAAEPHIVIAGASESLDAYRDTLLKVRRVHDVPEAQFVSLFRPKLADEAERERVKRAVRARPVDLVPSDTVLCAQLGSDESRIRTASPDHPLSQSHRLSHSPWVCAGAAGQAPRFATAAADSRCFRLDRHARRSPCA